MKPDLENAFFWDEPCGVTFAGKKGFDIDTFSGLTEFDEAYFELYPYLKKYLDTAIQGSKSILEIGLGLGTVSRYLAKEPINYTGLDVANGPVKFVQNSFKERELFGKFVTASILELPEEMKAKRFETIVTIGCLHHTGDLARALAQCEDLLTPEGKILIMVYNEFDLFRVVRHPFRSISRAMSRKKYYWDELDPKERGLSDKNMEGSAAPHTAYVSTKLFTEKTSQISYSVVKRENFHNIRLPYFKKIAIPRNILLRFAARFCGVCIFAVGTKF